MSTCQEGIKTIKRKVTDTIYKNARIEGNELIADKHVTDFVVVNEFNPVKKKIGNLFKKTKISEHISTESFPLREVSFTELQSLRRSNTPSFVLKRDGKLFYTKVPNTLKLLNCRLLGTHKCSHENKTCGRLSAAPDELGGCAKVRGTITSSDVKDFSKPILGIELFPWITYGYETFNMGRYTENPTSTLDVFVVLSCEHYLAKPIKVKQEEKDKIKIEKKETKSAKEYSMASCFRKYGYNYY